MAHSSTPTAEDLKAEADAQHLRTLAADCITLPPGVHNPEATCTSRNLLRWLSENHWFAESYLPRTWGYTILRTTYTDDEAFQAAADALGRYMRARADAEIARVAEDYERLRTRGQLPEGVAVDRRPSDEFYVNRFVNEVVQDQEQLENAAVADVCAYFRRWALARWHMDERYFSAATPRLKTAILFDEETVTQLQGVGACRFAEKGDVWKMGREFWVKMVEAEPKERGGPNMNQGVTDCFRVRLQHLQLYWFDRDRSDPAYMVWEVDERFPGEWFFTDCNVKFAIG
jgi:hypothetical protein